MDTHNSGVKDQGMDGSREEEDQGGDEGEDTCNTFNNTFF